MKRMPEPGRWPQRSVGSRSQVSQLEADGNEDEDEVGYLDEYVEGDGYREEDIDGCGGGKQIS